MQFLPNRKENLTSGQSVNRMQTLQGVSLESVRTALIKAFEGYAISMNPTLEEFRSRMERVGFVPALSAGVVSSEELRGFVLVGAGTFEDTKTVYNAGTGVLSPYRGNRLTRKMYDFLLPRWKETEISQTVLEVIDTNKVAVKAYESVGLQIRRKFLCAKLHKPITQTSAQIPIKMHKVNLPDWEAYQPLALYNPSWQFSQEAIMRGLQNEVVLEAYEKTTLVGYILFTPHLARISQFGVHPEYRKCGIEHQMVRAVQLLTHRTNVSILNVEQTAHEALQMLEEMGFIPWITQYEMQMHL